MYTDDYEPYKSVIPESKHISSKYKEQTNYIERWNLTLRRRISRFERKTISLSKKLENHIKSLEFFIYSYNLAVIG